MDGNQTFILAVLAVIVTPLINYFITAQANRAIQERAREAAVEARRTALAIELLRGEANAAYQKADHFNQKIEKALVAVKETNGALAEAVAEKETSFGPTED